MDTHFKLLLKAYEIEGGDADILKDVDMAHLMVHGNEVLSSRVIPGLQLRAKKNSDGVDLYFRMGTSFKYERPIQVCFGLIPEEGTQRINLNGVVEDNAGIKIVAYCLFPNAVKITHVMNGKINVGNNSFFDYEERHFHGSDNGVRLVPRLNVSVGDYSRFSSRFFLTHGRVGTAELSYAVSLGRQSTADLIAKICGFGSDVIKVDESIDLVGEGSRGLAKSRIVVRQNATGEVVNQIIARAAGCIGHIDCIETLVDSATASAYPSLKVYDSSARVTHEAAVGRLDNKQLNALMAKGLTREQAIDVLIKGFLK